MHLGRLLYEGGWYQEYQLGEVNASPEFHFPLQLVYVNNRATTGPFGAQWFCPQLESTVIPKDRGALAWQMPSGSLVMFLPDPDITDQYHNSDSSWLLKGSPDRLDIWNQEGWTFRYKDGHLQHIISPTGRALEYVWTGDRLLGFRLVDTVSNQQKDWLSLQYSDDKKAIALFFNGVQHKFAYENGRFGRLAYWLAPNGQQTAFTYADVGVLEYAKVLNGDTSTFVTQVDDQRLSKSDQKDPAHWNLVQDPDFKYSFSASLRSKFNLTGNAITATSNTGLVQSADYNYKRGIITEIMPGGLVRKTYFYEAPGQKYNGKVRRIEENDKLIIEYFYDQATGLLVRTMDGNGEKTNFEYPPDWKPSRQNPWDPKPISIWRGDKSSPQILSQYWYDDAGRVLATVDAAGAVNKVTYTPRGELESVAGSDGVVSKLSYDSFGRCVQAMMGDQKESIEYDDLGRPKSKLSSDGTKTEFVYDELGNVSQVLHNGVPAVQFIRDGTGKITGKKDALGRTQKIDTDAHGNVLAEYAPDNSVTKYEYDQFNRRTAQIDGNNNKITFDFDPASHITKQVNALGNTINWTYDVRNRLVEQDNGVQKIKTTYDDNGHVATVDYGAPDQQIAYTYDDKQRVESAVTPATAFYYIYDKLGRTDAIRAVCGPDEHVIRFRYNYSGQRTGLVLAKLIPAIPPIGGKIGYEARYSLLQQTEYTYDSRRLGSILSNGKIVVSYKYDATGRPVLKTYGNGIQASISYDTSGHLSQMSFTGGPIAVPLLLAYEWDAADQVIKRTWNGEVLRYSYDPVGRLAKVTQVIDDKTSQELESYKYDKAGNITEKTLQGVKTILTYNAANELTSASASGKNPISYSYDAAARLINFTGGPTNTYGWLDKVIRTSAPNGAQTCMVYWPDGQLAAEGPAPSISNVAYIPSRSNSECFLWDGLALLRRGDTIYIAEPHPSGGATIASHPIGQPTELTYYLNDLLGTTLAVIKKDGVQFNNLTSFGQMRHMEQASLQPAAIQASAPAAPVIAPQQQLPATAN